MHGFQQSERVDRVVTKIFLGKLHGLAGFNEGSEVHDGIDAMFLEDSIERRPIRCVRNDKLYPIRDRVPVAVREIVADDDVAAFRQQLRSHDAADVSGTAGNQNALAHLARSFAARALSPSTHTELHQKSQPSASTREGACLTQV